MTNHGKLGIFFLVVVFVGFPMLGNLAKKDKADREGRPAAKEDAKTSAKGGKRLGGPAEQAAPKGPAAPAGPALTAASLAGTTWDVPISGVTAKITLMAGNVATIQSPMGPGQGTWSASGTSVTISGTVAGQSATLTGSISGDSLTLNGQRATRSK